MTHRFPERFVWGAATSAYQIEGATKRDGRGASIWDSFCHTPGKIADGSNADVACDHYSRWREDVALMRELGLGAYRFSIAWPRVLPEGVGRVEPRGLDFYSRLVDALLEADIQPFVTLYHWDLPLALHERGGWTERDVASWFGEYARVVGEHLGDRVRHFITLNEPQVFGVLGYLSGEHAPGLIDFPGYAAAAHHINLAHGEAVRALRSAAPNAEVGITLQLPPVQPLTESAEDRAAAQRFDGVFNRWYTDPLLLGRYPADTLELMSPMQPPVLDGDLERIAEDIDFVGLNNYFRAFVRHAPEVPLFEFEMVRGHHAPGTRKTAMDWEVWPDSLHTALARLRTDYGNPPVYVTENGSAEADEITGGRVRDAERIRFLHDYIAAAHRALEEGSALRGYFVWSLFDNFEWSHGLGKRFGIVHVDYDSLERTPKDSARWFSELARTGELPAAP